MAIYSKDFTNYYDLLITDYDKLISSIKSLIKSFHPEKKLRVLELGCGTGNILQQLPKAYEIYGLDISPDMVHVAKKKLPHGKFFVDDMTNFSFSEKFDVILCVFDSINHLTKFSQWEKVFKLAAKHLDTKGVFIFDMNTPKRLNTLTTFKPYVQRINSHTVALEKITKEKNNLYKLQIYILENIHTNNISVLDELIVETTFDKNRVERALEKYFIIKKRIDPFRKRVTKNTGRIFFACTEFARA